jgi:archaellum biogenesis ATPase FlaH
MTSSETTWIKTGNFLLDECIEKGIPQGKLTMMVGKSRQTGKSMMYMSKMMSEWIKSNRQMKLKRIFDKLENNS